MKHKNQRPRDHWVPLQQSIIVGKKSREHPVVRCAMETWACTEAEAIAKLEAYEAGSTYWINDLYQVERREDAPGLIHLNVRRRDGAIVRDWRHLQRIKNELIGPECEAIEIFPAESRLVDQSNKYHLWGMTDPTLRIPVGIDNGTRDVVEEEVKSPPGMRQRAMPREDAVVKINPAWKPSAYPGDFVRRTDVARGQEFGFIVIQQWHAHQNVRVRVGAFLPGHLTAIDGDTPKMEPDMTRWCFAAEADAAFEKFVDLAIVAGWSPA